MPPGTPKTRLIRIGGGRMPSSSQRTALTTWPTSKASTSSAIPASVARSMIPRPAGGGVMKVSSPKFIEPDSTPEMSGFASRPVVRSSIVMSLAPPVETIVSTSQPARIRSITSTNSSGRPLGVPSSSRTCRWATVAPAAARLDRRVGDLLGRVRDVRVVLAEHVGAGDRDGEHDRVAVPAHLADLLRAPSEARSSSVIGREPARPGSQSTSPNSASTTTCAGCGRGCARWCVRLERPSSRDRALHGDRLERRVDLAVEADRAAADDVLVAARSRAPSGTRRGPPRGR